ncbi:MAG: hypothetical protein R6U98_34415, partial [Pirellulaceae bacterium]
GEDIATVMARQARLMELVVHEYPQAIKNIEPEYGFHFDDGNYIKSAETDRFFLYPHDAVGERAGAGCGVRSGREFSSSREGLKLEQSVYHGVAGE